VLGGSGGVGDKEKVGGVVLTEKGGRYDSQSFFSKPHELGVAEMGGKKRAALRRIFSIIVLGLMNSKRGGGFSPLGWETLNTHSLALSCHKTEREKAGFQGDVGGLKRTAGVLRDWLWEGVAERKGKKKKETVSF